MAADHIDRARDIIERYLPAMPDQQAAFVTRDAARALDAAGLLASPGHDAAVAAKALRDAAPRFRHDRPSASVWAEMLDLAAVWAEMLDLADQIEAGD